MDVELPKITYLFGAGASALALPTIKELPGRIRKVKNFVEENYLFDDNEIIPQAGNIDIDFKYNDAKKYLTEGLEKLIDVSLKHSTIDTYAKKLYITDREQELKELIFFLAIYFNIEQKRVDPDPRYTTFLISILDSSAYSFPDNLKFLTWNYDLQFELSYDNIIERNSADLDYRLFNTKDRNWGKNKFSSIKINGSCNVKGRFEDLYLLTRNIRLKELSKDDIKWALEYGYTKLKLRINSYQDTRININFAWFGNSEFINKLSELHNETEVLVVIGYSFPFFNREVDRNIIRAMVNLKKIYIQDLLPNNIASRFLSILPDYKKRNIEIIPIDTVDEFFLPPEL